MSHPVDQFIVKYESGLSLVRACRLCGHVDTVRKLPRGRAGRGWGFREGNKQRGRLIQHVLENHPQVRK